MTAPLAASAASGTPASAALRDWQAVRGASDIQYAPLQVPPPAPPPEWLQQLGKWLESLFAPLGRLLGISWPVLEKVLIGLAVIALLALVWRLAAPLLARARTPRTVPAEPEWSPGHHAARTLLEDADRLAAQGRYDEAAHLLLRRSVGQIAEARPDWLVPASTAREIAALPGLPESARRAFSAIAERVERSLFALRPLAAQDWHEARQAYADFALAGLDAA